MLSTPHQSLTMNPSDPFVQATRLTSSELSIVALLAEGASNDTIARQMFISRRTVETHMANIFRKLGFTTRVQVAVWFVRYEQVRAAS
jgi:DNA-binding NarL/FixJ family response regulator